MSLVANLGLNILPMRKDENRTVKSMKNEFGISEQ